MHVNKPINLSIVIPVLNEAENLPECLDSLRDFDDVLVVDSGSTDRTCAIVHEFGREVIQFHWDGKFPKKRNWILSHHQFKHDWLLFLDADERMTPAFIAEMKAMLPKSKCNGFWVGYDNWFMGRMLRHGDPMRKLSLLRCGYGKYEKIEENHWSSFDMEIHEQLIVEGTVGTLLAHLEHHDRRSLESYYAKHNAYSSWEANRFAALKDVSILTRRQKLKYSLFCHKWFPWAYFLVSYLFKGGFLDGASGYYFALGKMFYFSQIQAKIHEAKQ